MVLYPVVYLSHQHFNALLALFPRSDIAGDFRGANDATHPVAHRRYHQRHRHQTAILPLTDSLKTLDALATAKSVTGYSLLRPDGQAESRW